MCNNECGILAEFVCEFSDTSFEDCDTFAIGWGELEPISSPGLESLVVFNLDVFPQTSLPIAEIKLLKPSIDLQR
jgi:hypothetical protein